MKRILVFILFACLFSGAASAQSNGNALLTSTYYVASSSSAPPGNDSNPGTAAAPWLTVAHAVASMGCGDTLNVVADGNFVAGDASLPALANCASTTTIQSSALTKFAPPGYRTNPPTDSANYGKLSFTNQGLNAQANAHGNNYGMPYSCAWTGFSSMTIANPGVFTINCGAGLPISIGSQVEFEILNNYPFPSASLPAPLVSGQHYYVVAANFNCVMSIGCAAGSTFSVAAAPGGTPIQITACDANCLANTIAATPVAVNTSTSVLTLPDTYSPAYANGTPVAFSAAGAQTFGTLPAPLALDTVYYVINASGRNFQVAATSGGAPIALTTVGTGLISVANTNLPSNWAFRGLELAPNGSALLGDLLEFGAGTETTVFGMVSHMEVDRCYLHGNDAVSLGGYNNLGRHIVDNGQFIYIHDSYLSGATYSEAQAIQGAQAVGPTSIVNNFLEAAGENTLYGGETSTAGLPNSNHLFSGNYYYKPPTWKQTQSAGAPIGSCLYDATDPLRSGGEWFRDTTAGQNYQCGSDFLWHATASALPALLTVKDMAEHKNGRLFSYVGNLFNYVWAAAQAGEFFNNSLETGSGPGFADDHIVITNNALFNGYQFSERRVDCGATVNLPCLNTPGGHTTTNNLMVFNPLACGVPSAPSTCGFAAYQSAYSNFANPGILQGDAWSHNTFFATGGVPSIAPSYVNSPNMTCSFTAPINLETASDNIFPGDYAAQCMANGGSSIAAGFANSSFSNNVLMGGSSANYASVGSGNTWAKGAFPANNAALGYVNATGGMTGDYHLASTSPFSAQNPSATLLSDDGTDLGADIDALNMAISGAAAGTPPWNQQMGLRLEPGSGQAVLRYMAPTNDPCVATFYGAPARTAANLVTTVADSSPNSISDGRVREALIAGLNASTQYSYKLACGGGVVLVGALFTRAARGINLQFTLDWSSATPLQYSTSRNMSNPVSLPPATRQFIPVAANSVVYVQQGTNGPITMLIAP